MFCPSRYVLPSDVTACASTEGAASSHAERLASSAKYSEALGDGLAVSNSAGTACPYAYLPSSSFASRHGVSCIRTPAVPVPAVQELKQACSNEPNLQPANITHQQQLPANAVAADAARCSGHAHTATDTTLKTAAPASLPNTAITSATVQTQIPANDDTHNQLNTPAVQQHRTSTSATAQQHPIDYWEDQYQLPLPALRSHWPDPSLLHLLTQQANCLYDCNLQTELSPSAAAALESAAAADRVRSGSNSGGDGMGDSNSAADRTDLLPVTVQQSLQQCINSTAAGSSSSSLSGVQLLQYIKAAAAKTAAAVAAVQSAADGTKAQQQPAVAPAAVSAQQSMKVKQQQQQQHTGDPASIAAAAAGAVTVGGDEQLSSSYLLRLACPQLMVGYQSDLLQVPASYLPLWRQLGFTAVSTTKTILYTALAPGNTAAITAAFCKDLSAMYSCCGLGCMRPWQQTDGPPIPMQAAAAAAGQRVAFPDAAVVPICTAASSSSGYSGPAAADSAARVAGMTNSSVTSSDSISSSCWLRNLAGAARSLQAQLLLKPPGLLFPPPWVVTSPDSTQPQEASFVIFVVIPDNDMTVVTQEGSWNATPAAASSQQRQQQQFGSSHALAMRSFETVARYMAPVTAAAAASRNNSIPNSQQQQQCYAGVSAPPPIDVVIQLVAESAVCCPAESQLRGLAMNLYHKVRRRQPSSTAAAADTTLFSNDQQQQSSQQMTAQQDTTAAAAGGEVAAADVVTTQPVGEDQVSAVAAVAAAVDPLPPVQDHVMAPWVTSTSAPMTDVTDTAAAAADEPGVLMYEPLITLPPAQQQQLNTAAAAAAGDVCHQQRAQNDGDDVPESAGGAGARAEQQQQQQQQGRTLHCCYYWLHHQVAAQQRQQQEGRLYTAAAASWLAVSWTDNNAGLLESKLIQIPSELLPAAAAAAVAAAGQGTEAAVGCRATAVSRWVCATVLAESLTLAADVSSSVSCGDVMSSTGLVISRLGNQVIAGEDDTWRGLLSSLTSDDAAKVLDEILQPQAAACDTQQTNHHHHHQQQQQQEADPVGRVVSKQQQQQQQQQGCSESLHHCPVDSAGVWSDLKQHLAAALAALRDVEAAPAAAATTPQQQQQSRIARIGNMIIRHISVVTITPESPLYLGSSKDHPQGVLLLQPGLQQQQQQSNALTHANASIVWMSAAAAADSLLPGEVDAARLLHINLLAAAAVPHGAWAAAAAAAARRWCSSKDSRQDTGVQQPTAVASNDMLSLDAGAPVAAHHTPDAVPQQQQQQRQQQQSMSQVSVELGLTNALSPSSDVIVFTPDAIIIDSPSSQEVNDADQQDLSWQDRDRDHVGDHVIRDRDHLIRDPVRDHVIRTRHDGDHVIKDCIADAAAVDLVCEQIASDRLARDDVAAAAAAAKRRRLDHETSQQQPQQGLKAVVIDTSKPDTTPNPAAVVASIAAELSALSVVGVGLHGLFGYDACAALSSRSDCSLQAASAAAAAELCPSDGSAVHLPLHAAAAWRLWVLAAAMDDVAT